MDDDRSLPGGQAVQNSLMCCWMGLPLLVQVHGWWTSPSLEARLCRTLWCAAGWGCPCWSSYVDDGPDLPQRPSCTELWQIHSYISEKLCVDEPACACLTNIPSDASNWQKEKNSNKNFKEIADLLFITEGLTRWLSNLTARTFDDNQQFNFFLNLDFFFSPQHQSQLKIAEGWMLEGRILPITAFLF